MTNNIGQSPSHSPHQPRTPAERRSPSPPPAPLTSTTGLIDLVPRPDFRSLIVSFLSAYWAYLESPQMDELALWLSKLGQVNILLTTKQDPLPWNPAVAEGFFDELSLQYLSTGPKMLMGNIQQYADKFNSPDRNTYYKVTGPNEFHALNCGVYGGACCLVSWEDNNWFVSMLSNADRRFEQAVKRKWQPTLRLAFFTWQHQTQQPPAYS
ncbi:hypothetical protein TRVA0_042S00166 [Trichomonascus vanleenenianus]|uniref:uncharacterized protein n=1 Tax=Trichomonascus vanleenenianus TaxID=2268995 RepID=UPI003ECAC7C0